ncbi:hypothetical protein [Caproiciproducens sp.]
MGFLEKFCNKTVHFLFPFIERFYLFIDLGLFVAAWSLPETYWKIRVGLLWTLGLIYDIYSSGVMERDHLSIQPETDFFYRIYRTIDWFFFPFYLIWLIILLIPQLMFIARVFSGVIIVGIILRAVGDHKYRPKKPEE